MSTPEATPLGRLFVPSGSVVRNEAGDWVSPLTELRAQVAIDYYHNNQEQFTFHDDSGALLLREGAFIAISGGRQYALPSSAPLIGDAAQIQRLFVAADIPPQLYERYMEDRAADSIQNLAFAVLAGILNPQQFTAENPLRIVTGREHGKRMMLIAHYLKFLPGTVEILDTGESPGPAEGHLYEQAKRELTGLAPGDLAGLLERREILINKLHNSKNRHRLELPH